MIKPVPNEIPDTEAGSRAKYEFTEMLFLGGIIIGEFLLLFLSGYMSNPVLSVVESFLLTLLLISLMTFWMRKRGIGYGYFRFSRWRFWLLFLQLIILFVLFNMFYFLKESKSLHYPVSIAMLTAISITILWPLTEELLFRGLIFEHLRRNFGTLIAIVLTSLLFGIGHIPQHNFWFTFVHSIISCLAVVAFKSLLFPISFHIFTNTRYAVNVLYPALGTPIIIISIVAVAILTIIGIVKHEHPEDIDRMMPPR
jgi:membrane protease YdiL (CAAX protease family)